MKNLILSSALCLFFIGTLSAQFDYEAWNTGIEYSNMSIANGMSTYQMDGNNKPFLVDSVDSHYHSMLNYRFNIEVVTTRAFIKTGISLPIRKPEEMDTATLRGHRYQFDLQFGFGFKIKEV